MKKQKNSIDLQQVHEAFNTAYQFVKQHSEIENTHDYWSTVNEDYTKLCREIKNPILTELLNVSYAFLTKQGMEILRMESEP